MEKYNNIYYVIEYETQPGEGYYEELTGSKVITGYIIKDNIPTRFCDIVCDIEKNSEEELNDWLSKYSPNQEFKFKQL